MGECYTDIEFQEYKWHIRNLKSYEYSTKFFLCSSDFGLNTCKKYINFKMILESGELSLDKWLSFRMSSVSTSNTLFGIYILNRNREKILKGFIHNDSYRIENFCKIDTLIKNDKEFIINDTFSIICRFFSESYKNIDKPFPILPPKCEPFHDYVKLFETRDASDVMIIIDECHEVKAHRAILMARSSVFADILNTYEIIHGDITTITIKDVKLDIFNELLRFIYTNQVGDISTNARELLLAAISYKVDILKQLCEHSCYKSITFENAVEMFMFAYDNKCENLEKNIKEFIYKYIKDVVNTVGYKKMEESYGHLITKLFINRS